MSFLGSEKIAELSKSYPDQAAEALAEGNIERLQYLLGEMMVGHKELSGLLLFSHINMPSVLLAEKGEEALERMMTDVAAELVKPYVKLYQQDEKRAFEEIIALYRNQCGAQLVPLKEDADEVEYQLSPCVLGTNPLCAEIYQSGHGVDKDGVPLLCRACNKWQQVFNEAVGDEVWTMTPNATVPGACNMKLRKQAGKGADIFGKQELWLNATPKAKQALAKVIMGDLDIAPLLENQNKEWTPWHDYGVRWYEYIFAWVIREYGLDYYDAFMAKTYDPAFGLIYAVLDGKSDEEALALLAKVWHYHIAEFHIEEEENRFCFVLDPCGSGGRLYRGEFHLDSFHYGGELSALIEEEHPIAFNRKNAPTYCTHCASSNRDMFKGNPLVFVIDGMSMCKPGAPCRQYLYKQGAPREVEPDLLRQVGMTELQPLKQ